MRATRGLLLWSLALTALGIVLLLNNFLLLSGFNAGALWPLVLVVIGGVILLRGDFVPSAEARSFGITRGSVESAALEISAGEIDVHAYALAARRPPDRRAVCRQLTSHARCAGNPCQPENGSRSDALALVCRLARRAGAGFALEPVRDDQSRTGAA